MEYFKYQPDVPRTMVDTIVFVLDYKNLSQCDTFYRSLIKINLCIKSKALSNGSLEESNEMDMVLFCSSYSKASRVFKNYFELFDLILEKNTNLTEIKISGGVASYKNRLQQFLYADESKNFSFVDDLMKIEKNRIMSLKKRDLENCCLITSSRGILRKGISLAEKSIAISNISSFSPVRLKFDTQNSLIEDWKSYARSSIFQLIGRILRVNSGSAHKFKNRYKSSKIQTVPRVVIIDRASMQTKDNILEWQESVSMLDELISMQISGIHYYSPRGIQDLTPSELKHGLKDNRVLDVVCHSNINNVLKEICLHLMCESDIQHFKIRESLSDEKIEYSIDDKYRELTESLEWFITYTLEDLQDLGISRDKIHLGWSVGKNYLFSNYYSLNSILDKIKKSPELLVENNSKKIGINLSRIWYKNQEPKLLDQYDSQSIKNIKKKLQKYIKSKHKNV